MGFDTDLVITGVGVVSPNGVGREAFWSSLTSKTSGITPLSWMEDTEWPVRFGGEVKNFEPKKYVKPRKSLKVMCREIQLGFSAATLAIEDAALDSDSVDCDRFGVVCGTEMFYGDPHDLITAIHHCKDEQGNYDNSKWGGNALPHIYPLWMLMYLPNMVACHLAIANDARGPNNSICLGEASTLLALMEAAAVIERGDTDIMIVGGASSRLAITALVYRGSMDLSFRNEDPAGACRPFDLERDGMVNSEGAGAIILERREHALARGAKPIARLVGGSRSHAESGSDGICRAIEGALDSAKISAEDLSHLNGDGFGTVQHDREEALAIRKTLGDVPVLATKAYHGNIGAGTGAVELAATLCAMQERTLPGTPNYATPDPDCPVVVRSEASPIDKPYAMVSNRSLTGQTVAVVLENESA